MEEDIIFPNTDKTVLKMAGPEGFSDKSIALVHLNPRVGVLPPLRGRTFPAPKAYALDQI